MEVKFKEENFKTFTDYKIIRITSDSVIKSNFKENDINIAYLFFPTRGSFDRVIILLHGMGERNVRHLEYFGHRFAKIGIPLLTPILPFHNERRIKGYKDGEKFLIDDLEDTIRDYRQAIIDIRENLNYLESKGLDKSGFTLLGFSFGGMIGTILMGVEERIKNGLLAVTGGNFEYITWKSIATKVIRQKYKTHTNYETYGCTYEKCAEIHKDYWEILKKIKNLSDIDRIKFKKECFLFDPLTFAPLINGRKVILVRAIFDEIFPKESTLALKKAINTSTLINLLSDHYLIIAYRRFLFNKVYELVKEG
ncbi:alpha/beta fold hydrolase [Caldisericum exile]|uniref:hypothetical protein n=1 Tax=Caldisericum exile TaxID=693075 RepID=UPI0012EA082B|nr:hypothetical protein [Caldisericum exile]